MRGKIQPGRKERLRNKGRAEEVNRRITEGEATKRKRGGRKSEHSVKRKGQH